MLALETLYHAAGVAEVFVTLAWIIAPPTLLVAFILETANRLTNVVFQVRAAPLGVDEGDPRSSRRSSLQPRDGATLGWSEQVRMLVWTAFGVFF